MKKLFFILALFVFTATFAQVMTPEELDEYYSSSQSFFNGLLTANIEFSQDKYNVGDSIDVKIYFQVDSSKNIENYKFAIPKPSDWYIYLLIRGRTKIEENLTDELINDIRTEYNDKNNLIYCDSELILDNNNPTGYYHLSYKVPQKVSPQKILGKYSNVITRNVSIFKYKNVKRYNGFNDYGSYMRETEDNDDYYAQCRVNIKIADKSLKAPNLNKIEFGDNKKASINREVKLFQAKKVDHNQNLRDRLTQEVLSDKTTHCALAPEPHTIEGYSPNLGTIAIDNYEPFGSYNSIRIDANDNPDFCGLVQYRDVNNELYEFYIILTDNYFLGGEVKIFKSQGSPGTPDIYVPAIGVMQKINENGEVLAQTGIDNGTYFLNDFAPDDDIRYAAITSTAMILEKDAVNVIVNNSAFGLDPQTVYYLINEDNFQLNISFRPASQVFEDGVYYLQNQQIIYSNKLFDSQMRAESFSVNSLSNNQRELLLIYGDIDVNHPGLGNSGFVPVELEPGLDYDYDFVHIESSDLANTSIALHELGHAHHWHHAGFSLANRVQHSWTGSYSKELAWREGFATFFSSLVRKNTSPLFFDSPTSYLIYSSKNVEIPTGLPKGNNCEGAVCGFLWDLYDYPTNDDDACDSNNAVSLICIWNATKGAYYQSVTSVDEFLTSLFSFYPSYQNEFVGSVMTAFQIYDEVVENGETLVIPPQRTNFDFTEFSSILVEEGGTLEILDNTIITFSNPSNCFYVKGDIIIGDNVTFNNVGNISDRQIVLDNTSPVVFDNSNFTNCNIEILGTDVEILNCEFESSSIEAYKALNKEEILVDNCNFSNVYETSPSISIDNYYSADIKDCTFENTYNSILFCETGNKSGCMISNNSITNSTGISIDLYHSRVKFLNNNIIGNEWGLCGVRKSNISLLGPNQYFQDSDDFELVFEHDSFPIFFEHNTVSHDNSNSESLITVVHAVNVPYNVKNNNWGNPLNVRDELDPYGFFDFTPIWNGLRNEPTLEDSIREMYTAATEALDNENYLQAEAVLKEIIEVYSNSTYAVSSANDLITVFANTSHDFADLKTYYNFIMTSNLSTELSKTCDYLSNHCNILLEDYATAINWFEYQINHPYSQQDSVYALIDLNHTYLLLDKDERSNLIKDKYCFKPLSFDNFHNKRSELIGTFFDSDNDNAPQIIKPNLSQNYPNPFNPETTISFTLPEDSKTKVSIYNIKGQKVKDLLNEHLEKGQHNVVWKSTDKSGNSVASGVYLYKLEVNGKMQDVKKCLLLK